MVKCLDAGRLAAMCRAALVLAAFMPFAALADWHWQPAPDWQDTPDPIASPRAKKGGTIRFNGSMPPKSLNGYVDNNTYTRMTFSLMYEPLLGTDSDTLEFTPGPLYFRVCLFNPIIAPSSIAAKYGIHR